MTAILVLAACGVGAIYLVCEGIEWVLELGDE